MGDGVEALTLLYKPKSLGGGGGGPSPLPPPIPPPLSIILWYSDSMNNKVLHSIFQKKGFLYTCRMRFNTTFLACTVLLFVNCI